MHKHDNVGTAYDKATDGDYLMEKVAKLQEVSLTGSQLTLDAGADAGNYKATVVYTDLFGKTFRQDVDLTTTASGNNNTATAVLTSSAQSQVAQTQSTELTGAKSVLEVNEARRGKITSVGQNSQLSAEMGQFVARHAGAHGAYQVQMRVILR